MLKLIIIDDEYIVLQGLQSMINWSQYGVEVVGTAKNGLEGLKLFEETSPDIVMTDIRMPKMNGLQLVEKILQLTPQTKCLVFSGFNEYEYVKKALKLGVTDYVEKPITVDAITRAIQNMIDKIKEENEFHRLRVNWESSKIDLLERVLIDVLEGNTDKEKWQEYYGSNAKGVVGFTVCCLSSNEQHIPLHQSYNVIPVRYSEKNLNIVFHYKKDTSFLFENLMNWPGSYKITIGSGRTYGALDQLNLSYSEASQALRYGEFINEFGCTFYEDIGHSTISEDLSEDSETIIYNMRIGNKESLLTSLTNMVERLKNEKHNRDLLEREIVKIIYSAIETLKESGGDLDEKWLYFAPHIEITRLYSKDEVFAWFIEKIEMMMDCLLDHRNNKKHNAVERSCLYMKKNYSKDLSLQEVAEFAGMNPTYFSLLFKEQMGISYIKYLTGIRMEKAKERLQRGERVKEVSEKVGYSSYRHFSVLFKKYYGTSPGSVKD